MRLKQYTLKKNLTSGMPYLSEVSEVKLTADKKYMYSCDDVESLLKSYFEVDELLEEEVFVICVDTALRAIGVFKVFHGTVNASIISPREIYQRALFVGATGIFVVHNHPSGKAFPSTWDEKATKKLLQAGQLIGVQLVDHIILGETNFSFRKEGLIKSE